MCLTLEKKTLFVDPFAFASNRVHEHYLELLIANGWTLIFPQNIFDVECFRGENLDILTGWLKNKKAYALLEERAFDGIVEAPYYFLTMMGFLPKSMSFETSLEKCSEIEPSEKEHIMCVKKVLEKYGYPHNQWPNGEGKYEVPVFPEDALKYFGLSKNASYSNVQEAALNLVKNKKTIDVDKLLDMLEACNHSYMLMRAKKYNAHALILPNGKIVEITT